MDRIRRVSEADPHRARQLLEDALGQRAISDEEGRILKTWICAVLVEGMEDRSALGHFEAALKVFVAHLPDPFIVEIEDGNIFEVYRHPSDDGLVLAKRIVQIVKDAPARVRGGGA